MKRPEIIPEIYEDVYSYYEDLEPNKIALSGMHTVSSWLYETKVDYEVGAEEYIDKLINNDYRLIIACNHINMFDQFPAAAAIKKSQSLSSIIGNTFILAKAEFYNKPYKFFGLPKIMDLWGAIPIYSHQELQGRSVRLQSDISSALINTASRKLIKGQHEFIFPEGPRNWYKSSAENPLELQEIQNSIGLMAVQASQEAPIAILPMALFYGDDKRHSFTPNTYFGYPLCGPFQSCRKVVSELSQAMSRSLYTVQQISRS